jgi:hypothetical protein
VLGWQAQGMRIEIHGWQARCVTDLRRQEQKDI